MFEKLFAKLGYVPLEGLTSAQKQVKLLEGKNSFQSTQIKNFERQVEEMTGIIAFNLAFVNYVESEDGFDYTVSVTIDMYKLMKRADPHSLRQGYYYDEASRMIYYTAVGLVRQIEQELNALLRLGPDAARTTRDRLMRKAKDDYERNERYRHLLPEDRS